MFYFTPIDFTNEYGTSRPLRTTAAAYNNETNTAQSLPQILQGASGREGISQGRVDAFLKDAPTPQNPAAADPQYTPQDTNAKAMKNPLVWFALAAGIFAMAWIVRRL